MQKGRAATTLSAMSTPPLLLLLYDADVLHCFLPLLRCEALPGVTCSHLEALSRQLLADTADQLPVNAWSPLPALPATCAGSGCRCEQEWSRLEDELLC